MATRPLARTGAAVLASVLVAAGLLAVTAAPAHARPATGGVGRFGSSINWVEWGTAGQNLPNTGFTGTTEQVIGGESVTITCTASNLTSTQPNQNPFLQAYRPGTYVGDGFDDLYNIGGTGTANQLIAGLSNNYTAGVTVSLDVSCNATVHGDDVPLAGLVFGDAEASYNNEFVAATPSSPATWRVIDRYRTAGCTLSTIATRNAANRLQLTGQTQAVCASGPAAVAFMDGATAMRAEIHSGNGKSAIAIGVVLAADIGDAPASYGSAGHLASFGFTSGEVPLATATRVSDPAFALGSAGPPPTRIGAALDPEAAVPTTTNATGDDTTGDGAYGPPDDEDGLLSGTSIGGVVGEAHTALVSCSPVGASIAGWIDWNRDGDFLDAGERSQTQTCASGQTALSWDEKPDVLVGTPVGAATFLRLRSAASAGQLTLPTGLATSGETEDYRVTLDLRTSLALSKSLVTRARAGDQFTVSITDAGDDVASAATTGSADAATTGEIIVASGVSYTLSEQITSGSSTPADYQPAGIACTDVATGDPVLPAGAGPTWTLPALTSGARVSCTIENIGFVPEVALEKSASDVIDLDGNGDDAGDRVAYSFLVTNTGNATLTDVGIDETAFTGTGPLDVACPAGASSLPAGASVTCLAFYTLTQDDVDAGVLDNTAVAHGTPPGTLPDALSQPDSATVVIERAASIALVKSADHGQTGDLVAGELVTYSFVVTNTGNVTVAGVTVAETSFTGNGTVSAIDCPPGAASLAPGADVICTATYTVQQADVDQGTIANEAQATASSPDGVADPAPATDAISLPFVAAPSLELTKTVDPLLATAAGQTVTYSFRLTNTGNVTLLDVAPVEESFSGSGALGPVVCPGAAASVLPGASVTCTASYEITQSDVDAGTITNEASATATDPSDDVVTAAVDDAVLTIAGAPAIELTKSVTPAAGSAAGDVVTYTFDVRNAGNVTLTNLTVNEQAFSGTGALGPIDCPVTTLAPSDVVTCTAAYELTQPDVDAGRVENTAVATAVPPAGLEPPVSAPSTALVTIEAAPALSLLKGVSPDTASAVGEQVTYSFELENTGNVTLVNVAITELLFSGGGSLDAVACPLDGVSLAPGEIVVCTAAYTVSQADIDAGFVDNTAIATGTAPDAASVDSAESSARLTLERTAAATLVKTVNPGTVTRVDEVVTYTFAVQNTGSTTLSNVEIIEVAFSGTGRLSAVDCPPEAAVVAPVATVWCTATYAVTQADLDAGQVTNTATASADSPLGVVVTTPSDAFIRAVPAGPIPPDGGGSGDGELPDTGSELSTTAGLAVAGLLAIAGGLVLLGGAVRRRRTA